MTDFILASASASRSALLTGAGLLHRCIPAHLDEDALKDECLLRGHSPKSVAVKLAEAKSLSIAKDHSGLVLGGDQVLQLEQDLISKSTSVHDAGLLLRRMSGKTHYLHSAMALSENGHLIWTHVETAEMTVRTLTESFIDSYLKEAGDRILSSVGCYQLENTGIHLFEAIRGDYFTVLGLPMLPLLAQLRHLKVLAS